MEKLMKQINNNKGITLVELLATLVIVSIIGAFSYSVLSQGYANYQRIQVETELRDEADLIMVSIIKDLFVLKEGEIKLENKCTSGTSNSYLTVTKTGTSPEDSYKTGFESGKVFVKGKEVRFFNSNVQVIPNDCSTVSPTFIEKTSNPAEYNITFTLKTIKGKTEHTMKFENTVQVIDDSKEVAG